MHRHAAPPGNRPRAHRARRLAGVLAAALTLALAGAGQASAADVNNTKNAGFEAGLGNWTCSAGSGTTVSSPAHAAPARSRRPRPARTTPGAPRRSP